MNQVSFVHLHVHSEFSMVDSIVRINDLIDQCVEQGMPAVALTDMSNVYAAVKFYKQALKKGIKPILGSHIWLHNESDVTQPFKMLVFAQNQQGYNRICELLSQAYLNNQHVGRACVRHEDLLNNAEGVILVNDAEYGSISRALQSGHKEVATRLMKQYRGVFNDRFYCEILRIGNASESHNPELVELAFEHKIPLIATNSVRFIKKEDFDLHEIRVCIGDRRLLDDKRRAKSYRQEQYFKSTEQMQALFSDIPTALENTVELAKRCNLVMELGRVCLPDFEISTGQNVDEYLKDQSEKGLQKRLEKEKLPLTADDVVAVDDVSVDGDADNLKKVISTVEGGILTREIYDARLQHELNVIKNMGFAGYFLIVADFIIWSKNNDVPVGPGRGSGAGSLVAYSLGITDLDPMKYDLLFERFLNPERISMPDFDIDFCQDRREKVIQYVAEKYGREKVSQIITFGTLSAKAVIRDVGRVLGMGYGFVDSVSKLIPKDVGITIAKALEKEPELKAMYENNEDVQGLIDKAMALEGLARNVGKHAGGVVIAPSELTDFTALYSEHQAEDGVAHPVSHYDKNDIEDVGLIKFDFLGLSTLTIIDNAVRIANQLRKKQGLPDIVIEDIPEGDERTYDLLCKANTTAVFQLESQGMKALIKRLKPDCFDDLVALVALFRPGPLDAGMVDQYVARKHGLEAPDYLHDTIKEILLPTYGVIIYQEQVMNIAQVLSGYSLGHADILRKAMGKKDPEVMAQQRKGFVDGAVNNNIDAERAGYIFDIVEKFAGYGFNKSHSACYALICYQTAWLKANYPAAFMAANLSLNMDKTEKVVPLLADASELGLEVLLPNINQCFYEFTAIDEQKIYYGLGAIKGVGRHIIEEIITEREENGDYLDIFDLALRVIQRDQGKMNRRVLESLICSGTFDCFNVERSVMHANVTQALEFATQWHKSLSSGQSDLFSMGSESPVAPDYIPGPKWSDDEQLKLEKNTLGLYVSGHPINSVKHEINRFISLKLNELQELEHLKPVLDVSEDGDSVGAVKSPADKKYYRRGKSDEPSRTICGLIMSVRSIFNKKGEKFAFIILDDGTGRVDVSVFAKVFNESAEALQVDNIVVVEGVPQYDDRSESIQVRADKIVLLDDYRQQHLRGLIVKTNEAKLTKALLKNNFKSLEFCSIQSPKDSKSELHDESMGDESHNNDYNPPSLTLAETVDEEVVRNSAKILFHYRKDNVQAKILLERPLTPSQKNIHLLMDMFGIENIQFVY